MVASSSGSWGACVWAAVALLLLGIAPADAQQAVLLPNGQQQFVDANGQPYANGRVSFYVPGTTTTKVTWQDPNEATPNTNPVMLNSAGRAIIWGSGEYREVLVDQFGNTIWDQLTSDGASAVLSQLGTSAYENLGGDVVDNGAGSLAYAGTASVAVTTTIQLGSIAAPTITLGGSATVASLGNACVQGEKKQLVAAAAGTVFVASANIIINNGGANYTTLGGELINATCNGTAGGNPVWYLTVVPTTLPTLPTSVVRSYLAGLTLSAPGSANTFSVSAGVAADGTNAAMMTLPAALRKSSAAWAVGAANGCLDTGAIASTSWYGIFEIENPTSSVVDVLCTAEVAGTAPAPTLPSGYTLSRYIGSMKTDGSSNWITFLQNGDYFYTFAVTDYNSLSALPATLVQFSTPRGVVTNPILALTIQESGTLGNDSMLLAPGANSAFATTVVIASANDQLSTSYVTAPPTDLNSQLWLTVVIGSSAILQGNINTVGWIDTRGRSN
jgi:hypothetical protein